MIFVKRFQKSHVRTGFQTSIFEKTRVSAGFFKMPLEKTRPIPGIIPGTGRDGTGRDSNTALTPTSGDILYREMKIEPFTQK